MLVATVGVGVGCWRKDGLNNVNLHQQGRGGASMSQNVSGLLESAVGSEPIVDRYYTVTHLDLIEVYDERKFKT